MTIREMISSGLLELYVSGLASQQEVLLVEQYALQYPEIKNELIEIEKSIEVYAVANGVQPSAGVKESILSALNHSAAPNSNIIGINAKSSGKLVNMFNSLKWVAAAAVLLLISSIALNVVFYKKFTVASKNFATTRQLLALESQRFDLVRNDMAIVQNKYSMPVSLNSMPETPGATAKIFWLTNTTEVYIDISNLSLAPAGKEYQLWGIVGGKPVNGGMIKVSNGDIYHLLKMQSFVKAEAFAISIENAGGSEAPTKVVSMGKVI